MEALVIRVGFPVRSTAAAAVSLPIGHLPPRGVTASGTPGSDQEVTTVAVSSRSYRLIAV
jgi:hypothetical protein